MLNLQVSSPYKPCPYHCPMCIVDETKQSQFVNLYEEDVNVYFFLLQQQARCHKDIILTGSTEPTLFSEWLEEVILTITPLGNNIELQTKNYHLNSEHLKHFCNFYNRRLNTLSYSITTMAELQQAPLLTRIKNDNRLTILLTKEMANINTTDFLRYIKGFNQITFKELQCCPDAKRNQYVINNKLTDLTSIHNLINHLPNDISVRIDSTCMDSTNRYDIFRIDGYIYHEW